MSGDHPACLSARSGSLHEIVGALYTLIVTNMAMSIAALILGFKPDPEISLHEFVLHISISLHLLMLETTAA
jgi:hypothetical protein